MLCVPLPSPSLPLCVRREYNSVIESRKPEAAIHDQICDYCGVVWYTRQESVNDKQSTEVYSSTETGSSLNWSYNLRGLDLRPLAPTTTIVKVIDYSHNGYSAEFLGGNEGICLCKHAAW